MSAVCCRCEKRGFLSEVQLVLSIVMERLAQEDIQAIISGVATNPQLVSGIVAQLREAIQPPTPTVPTPGTGTVPPTVETQQPAGFPAKPTTTANARFATLHK